MVTALVASLCAHWLPLAQQTHAALQAIVCKHWGHWGIWGAAPSLAANIGAG